MTTPEHIDGPRGCAEDEVGAVLDLINIVFFPQEPRAGTFNPLITQPANHDHLRVLMVNGTAVAHAGLWISDFHTPRGQFKLGGIWGVATHPEYRRQGFGGQCVRDCMDVMRAEGCLLGFLGTPINDWYRTLGWENAACGWSFTLDRATIGLLPELQDDLGEGVWPDLEAMLALHTPDLGAVRPARDFALNLRRSGWGCLTASRHGKLTAYVLYHTGWRDVNEYAGDPVAIAGLIRAAFPLLDDPTRPTSTTAELGRITVKTPPRADGLPALLAGLRLPCAENHRGMYWVPDITAFLAALGLDREITVAQQGDGVTFRRGVDVVTLTPSQAIKLLLGPEKVADFAPDLLPVALYHWTFDLV